jgi:hypothetical protein
MKTLNALWLLLGLVSCGTSTNITSSPDGRVSVELVLKEQGEPVLLVQRNNARQLEVELGVIIDDIDLGSGLSILNTSETRLVDQNYKLFHGKQIDVNYIANSRMVTLANDDGSKLGVEWRVSNDGVGFRYKFFNEKGGVQVIQDELTSYKFNEGTSMWAQPMAVAKTGWEQSNPSYEEHYVQDVPVSTPSPLGAGWVYPTLLRSGDEWILLSESGLGPDYCGSRLVSSNGQLDLEFPSDKEVYTGKGHLPTNNTDWYSPWRLITIGSLNTIAESTMGTDLAQAAIDMNTDFVKPGIASWSWALLKDSSVNYETTKDFIKYAAEMGWAYCLIDVNWDTTIGFEKMKELVALGKELGVGLIVWYNSAPTHHQQPVELRAHNRSPWGFACWRAYP